MRPRSDRKGPTGARLWIDQLRHHLRLFVRNPVGAFFGIVFPVLFLVIFAGLYGDEILVEGRWLGPSETPRTGTRYIQYVVPAMAVFATAMVAYVNLATATGAERGDGTLKRLRTTPLPAGVYLAGRIGAAITIAAVTIIVLVGVGVVAYDFELVWSQLPAALTTTALGAGCCAALGMALAAIVRPTAVQAVAFGTLLPLAFVSEIFLFGDPLPTVLSTIGWVFPLRHFAVALAATADPTTTGAGFAWDHLAVIALWGIAGIVIARRWFAWDPEGETRPSSHVWHLRRRRARSPMSTAT